MASTREDDIKQLRLDIAYLKGKLLLCAKSVNAEQMSARVNKQLTLTQDALHILENISSKEK